MSDREKGRWGRKAGASRGRDSQSVRQTDKEQRQKPPVSPQTPVAVEPQLERASATVFLAGSATPAEGAGR